MDKHEESLKNLCNTNSRIKYVIKSVNRLENGKEILKDILKNLDKSEKGRVLKEQFNIYKGVRLSVALDRFGKFENRIVDKVRLEILMICTVIRY